MLDQSEPPIVDKLAKLASTLLNTYKKDFDLTDYNIYRIVLYYARSIRMDGVQDYRVETTSNPEYFTDQTSMFDKQWPVPLRKNPYIDLNISTTQFSVGVVQNHFVVLLYSPSDPTSQAA